MYTIDASVNEHLTRLDGIVTTRTPEVVVNELMQVLEAQKEPLENEDQQQ